MLLGLELAKSVLEHGPVPTLIDLLEGTDAPEGQGWEPILDLGDVISYERPSPQDPSMIEVWHSSNTAAHVAANVHRELLHKYAGRIQTGDAAVPPEDPYLDWHDIHAAAADMAARGEASAIPGAAVTPVPGGGYVVTLPRYEGYIRGAQTRRGIPIKVESLIAENAQAFGKWHRMSAMGDHIRQGARGSYYAIPIHDARTGSTSWMVVHQGHDGQESYVGPAGRTIPIERMNGRPTSARDVQHSNFLKAHEAVVSHDDPDNEPTQIIQRPHPRHRRR